MKHLETLKPGDRVAICAPGATFDRGAFKKGVQGLKNLGLVPVFAPHLFKKDFIFAGTIDERLKSFIWACQQRDIKIIWCVRGGYGTYAVAQKLAEIKAPLKPKLVVGISDVTALQLVLTQNWKWPSLHGPLLYRMGKQVPAIERKTLKSL